jgi:hypothetical protein
MRPEEIPYAVLMLWVLANIVLFLIFVWRRIRLWRQKIHNRYPYAVYRVRRRRLIKRYYLAIGLSIIAAILSGAVWAMVL